MGDQALDFQERFHRVHSALLQSLRPSSNPWVPAPWDLLPESNFSHPYDSFLKSWHLVFQLMGTQRTHHLRYSMRQPLSFLPPTQGTTTSPLTKKPQIDPSCNDILMDKATRFNCSSFIWFSRDWCQLCSWSARYFPQKFHLPESPDQMILLPTFKFQWLPVGHIYNEVQSH